MFPLLVVEVVGLNVIYHVIEPDAGTVPAVGKAVNLSLSLLTESMTRIVLPTFVTTMLSFFDDPTRTSPYATAEDVAENPA